MNSDDRAQRRATVLSRLSGVLEAVGFPHPIARVYAALTLAEGEGLSTSELMDQLGISKASVSNATQFLVGTQMAERYRVPGSRETHYRMLKGVWGDILAKKFAVTKTIRSSIEEAMGMTDSPLALERLEEMRDVYGFFEQEFEAIMGRWRERTQP